jgi:photosystem II stability/assembly factor-like uncharacterized protein
MGRREAKGRAFGYVAGVRISFPAAVASALLAAALTFTPDARANGRFPASNAIFFAPNDPDEIILRTTFGMVLSRDRGRTWDWVCERAIGLAGDEDPMFAVTPDGTVLASSFQGLAISRDRSCNYAFAGGILKDLVFIDLTSRPSTPGSVVAFASSYDGQDEAGAIYFRSTLFETTDEAKTFAPLGPSFDPTLLGETVDVTASDPDRIYVSAVRNPGTSVTAFLLTSRDHGKTWEENPIPLVSEERAAFIAAVDPVNADRVYVRTSGPVDKPSRLLLTVDAGKTFKTVFTGRGPLPGFALTKDGAKVWVGGQMDGVQVASTADFVFTQRSKAEVSCLALASDGLWACSNEKSGFVVGLSNDEGATFEPKLHFCDIRGPLECAAGTTQHTECSLGGTASNAGPPWPPQRALLGCSGAATPDAGAGDAGADAAVPDVTDARLEAGGGCSVRAPSPSPLAALLAGVAATIAFVRRRRR